jgi:hypothetical protein
VSALLEYDKAYDADTARVRVVKPVIVAATIAASNVATNKDLLATDKDLMVIGPPDQESHSYHLIRAQSYDKRRAFPGIVQGALF